MRRPATLVVPLALSGVVALVATLSAPAAQAQSPTDRPHGHQHPFTFAVIGDVPYGDAAQAHFPAFIAGINADPDVSQVTHLGDIKSGSTTCDDQRLEAVRRDFDLFEDPLYYTPGDNEWTDCHRANNGGYQPLERLEKVRSLFFAPTGTTQGKRTHVSSQADRGIPENQRWTRGSLSFATLHVVGSNDDLAPWTGFGNTSPTEQQVQEESQRMAAARASVRAAFAEAVEHRSRAVVLMQQADMFDPTVADPSPSDYSAFRPLVQTILTQTRRFGGPVFLFNGDSHHFNQDRPLAAGSPWLSFYGVRGTAENLRRVTVDGSDRGEADWLKVTEHSHGDEVLTFQQVPGV